MEWQPQEEPLGQLAYCLRDSLNSYNGVAQKQAEQVRCAVVSRLLLLDRVLSFEMQSNFSLALPRCDRTSAAPFWKFSCAKPN